jgi:multicomponent Na+:H+ antiporter subunit D
MEQHLIALAVVVPLLAAPVCLLLRHPRLVWGFVTLVTWSVLAMSIALLLRVLDSGPIRYSMGDWPPPIGIEFRLDVVNAFVLLIVSSIAAVVMPYAFRSVELEIPRRLTRFFYALFLLSFTGLLGITLTGDIFNAFVFLEIASLSTYALVAFGKDRRALVSAFRYLVMGTVGGTFYLIGVGFLYVQTGTLNMADMAERLPAVADSRTSAVAFAFLTVGLSLKIALFPLHLWLPGAYSYAPSMISAFLASTATKVAVYLMLRVFFTVFGQAIDFTDMPVQHTLLPLALIGALVMSLVAVFQTNVKRLLAYSSIAQIGYMVMGISLGTVGGLTAGIVHLFNHAMIKGALFLAVGCAFYHVGSVRMNDLRGLGKRMPWTSAAILIGGLSLIGMPLTSGFVSKWYLLAAVLEQDRWPLAVLILVSSLLAVAYVWRIVENAYFRDPPEDAWTAREAPLSMLVPTYVLIVANIWFGLDTEWSVGIARQAAEALVGGGR